MRFAGVERDGSSSMIMMARIFWAVGFCPSHWMRSCEASAYGIAFDGYIIMFEHGYASLNTCFNSVYDIQEHLDHPMVALLFPVGVVLWRSWLVGAGGDISDYRDLLGRSLL